MSRVHHVPLAPAAVDAFRAACTGLVFSVQNLKRPRSGMPLLKVMREEAAFCTSGAA